MQAETTQVFIHLDSRSLQVSGNQNIWNSDVIRGYTLVIKDTQAVLCALSFVMMVKWPKTPWAGIKKYGLQVNHFYFILHVVMYNVLFGISFVFQKLYSHMKMIEISNKVIFCIMDLIKLLFTFFFLPNYRSNNKNIQRKIRGRKIGWWSLLESWLT